MKPGYTRQTGPCQGPGCGHRTPQALCAGARERGPALSAEGAHVLERHGAFLCVDGVERAFVSDFRLGNQADA